MVTNIYSGEFYLHVPSLIELPSQYASQMFETWTCSSELAIGRSQPGWGNMSSLPTGCWAAQWAMWKRGALPPVTGLTDQMDYLILVTFNKELE